MRIIIRNSILFFLVFMLVILASTEIIQKGDVYEAVTKTFKKNKQGRIKISTADGISDIPMEDNKFNVINKSTGDVVDTIVTNVNGNGITELLDYNTIYILRQTKVEEPYLTTASTIEVEINQKIEKVRVDIKMPNYIKEYHRDKDNNIVITDVRMDVGVLMQEPELPNGCEITALTCTLNYYGYDATKTNLSDRFLPKKPFENRNGKLYGADPHKLYGGDPRSRDQGFYSYPSPVAEAADQYLISMGKETKAEIINGSSKEEIKGYLNRGIPIIMWITVDLEKPKLGKSWYLYETNEKFDSIRNSHTVVVRGYNENTFYIMDPLKGYVSYDIEKLWASYEAAGKYAMIILK
ncbi:C39 family peptidase [Virgibacillus flavescens]|uniref:C39 family peptidase n=1 Tax=Virgibacillus flavescens TaxID=1611422 RepID=UPI003D33CC94